MANFVLDYFIIHMKANPRDFEANKYSLLHKPSRISVWIANGYFFYAPYIHMHNPFPNWTLLEKWKFSKAFRQWKKNVVEAELIRRITQEK